MLDRRSLPTVHVRDMAELAFRLLFSSIFIGPGGEHIVDDTLIMNLMPPWVPMPRLASVSAGTVLLVGGGLVALGYRLRAAAVVLGSFLVVVTLMVHVPPVFGLLPTPGDTTEWARVVLQRSNLVKNLCLLGVCVQLWWHEPGALSLDTLLEYAARPDPGERRPVVLITGASTGLGLAIARRLIEGDRWSIVLTARKSSLARFARLGIEEGPRLRLRALDVTSAEEREAVIGSWRVSSADSTSSSTAPGTRCGRWSSTSRSRTASPSSTSTFGRPWSCRGWRFPGCGPGAGGASSTSASSYHAHYLLPRTAYHPLLCNMLPGISRWGEANHSRKEG